MKLSAAVSTVDRAKNLDGLRRTCSILSGASKLYIEDIIDDFCEDYIVPCVQANAVYENKYFTRYFYGTSWNRQRN